jgi:hypothetical protein
MAKKGDLIVLESSTSVTPVHGERTSYSTIRAGIVASADREGLAKKILVNGRGLPIAIENFGRSVNRHVVSADRVNVAAAVAELSGREWGDIEEVRGVVRKFLKG